MNDQPFDLTAVLRAAAAPPDSSGPDTSHADGAPTDPIAAFAELARIDLRTHDLDQVLTRVAELAKTTLRGADEVSVSLLDAITGSGATPAFTGALARESDERQYESGGPCVHAAKTGDVVLVDDMATEERWPDYVPRAAEAGVRSSLSMPLPTQDSVRGAINVYSRQAHAFDDHDIELARAFAGYASVAIANAHLYRATASLAQQMEAAMATRAVIEQAKGMIMAQRRCDDDEAFQILARASQHSNRKLRDIAAEVVRSAQRR